MPSTKSASRHSEPPPPAEDRERVIGEIRHELGNYFHKLYYLADVVTEASGPPHEPAAGPGALLLPTLRALEGFLKSAFAHFAPLELELVPIAVADIGTAMSQRLSRATAARGVRVVCDVRGPGQLLRADVGLLSSIAEAVAERTDARAGDAATVALSVDGERTAGVQVIIRVADLRPLSPQALGLEGALRWARAQRMVECHGGALDELTESGTYRVRLSLPG